MEETDNFNNLNVSGEQLKEKPENNGSKQIAGAIVIAGLVIAGAILLKGNIPSQPTTAENEASNSTNIELDPVDTGDRTMGNKDAKLTLILYEDFQCPFCERFVKDTEQKLRDTYVKNGDLLFVYRDYAFLGIESVRAAEAAWCAMEQSKFWEYHDYLFDQQNGENKGAFADANLKTFAKNLGLDSTLFTQCFDGGKYQQTIADEMEKGTKAGVRGTPKGFIVTKKNISAKTQAEITKAVNLEGGISFYTAKNIVGINGAIPSSAVTKVIDILLK